MKERRSERRFAVRWYMRAGHRKVDYVCGHVVEVSSSGLMFQSPYPYQVGDAIEMEIWPGTISSFRAVVTVVREASVSGGLYSYGAVFSMLSDATRQMLNDILLEMRRREFQNTYGGNLRQPLTDPSYYSARRDTSLLNRCS